MEVEKMTKILYMLPHIRKAHVYEPKIEDAIKVAYRQGQKEVVEFVHATFSEYVTESDEWLAQIKKWGIAV